LFLLINVDILYYFLQGSFVIFGRQDILTTTIGTEEHPGRVRTAGFGVGVRQYFGSAAHSSSFVNPGMMEQLARIRDELRREFEQKLESMGISQQYTPLLEDVLVPTRGELPQRRVVLFRTRRRTQTLIFHISVSCLFEVLLVW